MKLSPAQKVVLDKMKVNEWYSAYDLQCPIATLEALSRKGLVRMQSGLGAIYSPRVNIMYQKKST